MDNPYDNLHWASERGDTVAVEAFLASGDDPNAFDDMSFTPLHYAAREEHLEIINLLVRSGADVNAHDEPRIGDTPLGYIAGSCSLAVAEALLSQGADPTIRGWMQLNAMDRAKERKKDDGPKVYELLCKAARKFPPA